MPRPRPWTCPSLNCTSAYDRRTLLCRHLERVHNLLLAADKMLGLGECHRPILVTTGWAPSSVVDDKPDLINPLEGVFAGGKLPTTVYKRS
ncbi:hypothetical protein DB88DRAFT_510182 [Papiliotrema laurentii]|uniref:C2H2-type domain-containing protein n=1 Tax=Papiliotrema laurentii TaxID=5418 RepID=A0AAD9FRY4_PAPLA|nr:hypothetical protein DB88DRAFT_510182 [Papiliotrema laurentii]